MIIEFCERPGPFGSVTEKEYVVNIEEVCTVRASAVTSRTAGCIDGVTSCEVVAW